MTQIDEIALAVLRGVSEPVTDAERRKMAHRRIYEVASDESKTKAERIREIALRTYLLHS
jgi:hypothetical protein